MNSYSHQTVLPHEAISGLNVKSDGVYVDGTFGGGGHSKMILEKMSDKGILIIFDKDQEAISIAKDLAKKDARVRINHASFASMYTEIEKLGYLGKVDGILLDLGVSSHQIDTQDRGFSFRFDSELDMRMDQSSGVSAKQWLASVSESELAQVIKEYGQERYYAKIAKAIIAYREKNTLSTTWQLADIIREALPYKNSKKHPATKTFQAIRIVINSELDDLQLMLNDSIDVLSTNGRLVIISFHGLERKIVKDFMQSVTPGNTNILKDTPTTFPLMRRIKSSVKSKDDNPRSQSAIMSVMEKL